MSLKELYLFDGATRRPKWAGVCKVGLKRVTLRATSSDLRAGNHQRAFYEDTLVPFTVEAIIVPVKTSGRSTEDVSKRDLKYYYLDRGHIMAYSLGAPKTSNIMVPQGRHNNQKADKGFEKNKPPALSWRAFEIYLKFMAIRGFYPNLSVPDLNDDISVLPPNDLYINGVKCDLETPSLVDYGNNDLFKAGPTSYMLEYSARVKYSNRAGSSTALGLDVDISLLKSGQQPQHFISRAFDLWDSDAALDARLDTIEEKLERRIAARKYRKMSPHRTGRKPDNKSGLGLSLSLKPRGRRKDPIDKMLVDDSDE
jgi:hypothetical protein